MIAQRLPYISESVYLDQEQYSSTKHEYYAGSIYAMAGASEEHNLIAMNIAALLHSQLRGSACRAYPSDMLLKVMQTGLYTYPDFSIVCGPSQFANSEKRNGLVNPIAIIEILSPSTETYDRGQKFQHYRSIETLQEYILIAQNTYHIEHFVRQAHNDSEWLFSDSTGPEAIFTLATLAVNLPHAAVYEQIDLPSNPFLRVIE